MTTRRVLLVLLAVLAVTAAACGGDDGGGATTPPTETTTEEPTEEPAEEPTGEAAATLTAQDFQFSPTEVSVASGETLRFQSGGTAPHTFTVDGTDIDVQVDPGANEDVPIDLDPGDYPFMCRFHPQMQGTLTVS